MSWTTITDITAGELTVAELNAIINNLRSANPVGKYIYLLRAATTVETLVEGCWLECNNVSVLRADYPDLNTLLSGLGYPFGTADGSHMTLPPAEARALVSMSSGGHADVNALGDSDGVTKASRTPKDAAHTHTGPSHTHSFSATSGAPSAGVAVGTSGPLTSAGTETHTHSVSGTTGAGGTGATGSGGGNSGAFLVGGCWFIKAIT